MIFIAYIYFFFDEVRNNKKKNVGREGIKLTQLQILNCSLARDILNLIEKYVTNQSAREKLIFQDRSACMRDKMQGKGSKMKFIIKKLKYA